MKKYPKIEQEDFFDYKYVLFKFVKFKDEKNPDDFKCDRLEIKY